MLHTYVLVTTYGVLRSNTVGACHLITHRMTAPVDDAMEGRQGSKDCAPQVHRGIPEEEAFTTHTLLCTDLARGLNRRAEVGTGRASVLRYTTSRYCTVCAVTPSGLIWGSSMCAFRRP